MRPIKLVQSRVADSCRIIILVVTHVVSQSLFCQAIIKFLSLVSGMLKAPKVDPDLNLMDMETFLLSPGWLLLSQMMYHCGPAEGR